MKMVKLITLIFLVIFLYSCEESKNCDNGACGPDFELPETQYDIGNPSAGEVYSLELINRARSNPSQEALFLTELSDTNVNASWGYFVGLSSHSLDEAKTKLIDDFKKFKAKPPIAFNKNLNTSAKVGSEMQRDFDTQAHTINGVTFDKRITDAGYSNYEALGENIFAYSKSIIHAHAGFNIDWGNGEYGMQNPAGHRENIMNSVFREIGIYNLTENIPSSNKTGPQIITQDLGSRWGVILLTGVIYEDLNGNNFYDPGEGLPQVTVSLSSGSNSYAITSTEGAYTIPIDKSTGVVKIQAFSEDLPFVRQIKEIDIKSTNIKIDFTL